MDDWNRKADHSNPRMDQQDSPKQKERRLGMGSVAALRKSPGLTNRSRRKCARLAGVYAAEEEQGRSRRLGGWGWTATWAVPWPLTLVAFCVLRFLLVNNSTRSLFSVHFKYVKLTDECDLPVRDKSCNYVVLRLDAVPHLHEARIVRKLLSANLKSYNINRICSN